MNVPRPRVRALAVVVPAHNEQDALGECLAAPARARPPGARAFRPTWSTSAATLDLPEDSSRSPCKSISLHCVAKAA